MSCYCRRPIVEFIAVLTVSSGVMSRGSEKIRNNGTAVAWSGLVAMFSVSDVPCVIFDLRHIRA